MPSQRPGQVSPFFIESQFICDRNQLSTSQDNNGHARQNRQRDVKSRPRQERNSRREEGIRFNTGAPRLQRIGNRAGRRSGRQDRGHDDGSNDAAVPDYPPPSYATSIYPSTVTLVVPRQTTPQDTSSISSFQSPSPPIAVPTNITDTPSVNGLNGDCDTESSCSLEFIDSATNLHDDISAIEGNVISSPQLDRGRTAIVVEPLSGSCDNCLARSSTTRERRHTSLSPLRTFISHISPRSHDRPVSAHPSPNGPPYSHSNFLRSTASLKLPNSSSSILSSARGENSLTRKILLLKTHEKEEEPAYESLDAWELLDSPIPRETDNAEDYSTTLAPEFGQLMESRIADARFAARKATPPLLKTPPTSRPAVHPLSLRDRKLPLTHHIKKSTARRAAPPPLFQADTGPLGPVLTTVRMRINITPPPPEPAELPVRPIEGISNTEELDSSFQQALSTPLPMSPVAEERFGQELFNPVQRSIGTLSITNDPNSALSTSLNPTKVERDLISLQHIFPPNEQTGTPLRSEPGPLHTRQHYPGRPLPRAPASGLQALGYVIRRNETSSKSHGTQSFCYDGSLIDLEGAPASADCLVDGNRDVEKDGKAGLSMFSISAGII